MSARWRQTLTRWASGASARRAPTDAERAAVMVLVKSIYSRNHTPASLISSIKVTNLTATDLDGDGKFEFIGSFTSAAKNKFERDLFLIAKLQGTAIANRLLPPVLLQQPAHDSSSVIRTVC